MDNVWTLFLTTVFVFGVERILVHLIDRIKKKPIKKKGKRK